MSKQNLLVVDADPRSLRILEVALRKAGFAVTTAADGVDALRRMQRAPPDLLVCEANLPGQDGPALCRAVRADERLAALPVVFVSGDRSPAARANAIEAGADEFLGKPLLIKDLVARVRMLLAEREQAKYGERGAPSALTGSVGDLGLVDLFTSLDQWKKSAAVVCEGEGITARVWVRDGQVIDAEVTPLTGEGAFYRLLNWETGSFRVEFGPVQREARTSSGTQALLMEGMRRIDEMGRLAESLPFSTVLTVDFDALAAHLAEMPDELNGVLRLFDGVRSLRDVLVRSPVDDLSTFAVVQRLMLDGVLVRAEAAVGARRKPSLDQWLGAAPLPESAAPVDGAPSEAQRAAGPRDAGEPIIPLLRFAPLHGMRRERLRQETEEARQAINAGRPVRLTHVVELPPAPGEAMPQGMRRMSAAVGEAARKYAPDVPMARFARHAEGEAPQRKLGRIREVGSRPASDSVVTPLATPKLADGSPRPTFHITPPPPTPRPPHAIVTPKPTLRAAAITPPPRTRRRWAYGVAAALVVLTCALLLRSRKKEAPRGLAAAPTAQAAPAPAVQAPLVTAAVAPRPEDEYARALSSGEALLKRGKYRAAVAELRKANELQPDSVPALLALGDAFLEADLPRNALRPLQRAAQLDPKNARAQLLLGTAFQGLGHAKEAVKAYKLYLELEPRGEFAGDVRAIVANLTR